MAANTSRRLAPIPGLSAFLIFLIAAGISSARAAESWRVETIKLSAQPVRIYFKRDRASLTKTRVVTRDGNAYLLKRCGETYCTSLASDAYVSPRLPDGALPDAEVTEGSRNIISAWPASPTRRYAHGVLGDRIEAGAVVALDERRKRMILTLGADSVFEDLKVRIADVDGDMQDELIVVRSYLTRGAALAVIKQTGHGLVMLAETPPIGKPNRWLNPAGIADFDGDGRFEIAIVVTPHIGGRLEFWELRDRRLVKEMELPGFSNHAIGSRVQDMSAAADFDGDGIKDLALPADGRRRIRIISFAKGAIAEFARIDLPGQIVTEIRTLRLGGRPALIAGLDTGKLAILRR